MNYYHSVRLDEDKCKGCTNCIKRCPTQAIRVRDGKARIISARCIDCGECIRVCPHHAKRAVTDSLDELSRFKYKIALPAPTLYGQFNNLSDVGYVLAGLLEIGFDDVYEVSRGAEIVSDLTRQLMRESKFKAPVISSACPAIVRLVKVSYPDLCGLVMPLLSPMQVSARRAKLEAQERTGLPLGEIGCFFISPCPAKVTDIVSPIGTERTWVDHAFSISDIYPRLLEKMNHSRAAPRAASKSGIAGVNWANSGGESSALIQEQYLAADGMENVTAVLDQLEDERLAELDFIELNACPGGCVGGVLTVENPYVAKARIHRLRKFMPDSLNRMENRDAEEDMMWESGLAYEGAMKLSPDISEAMRMMREIDAMTETLPALDCGSCGAPSCRALAEDIVTGSGARLNDCIFILRKEMSGAGLNVPPDQHPALPDTEKPKSEGESL